MSFDTSNDVSVQATNDDATYSKLSCVNAGYFVDEFVKYFAKRPIKRAPVINRGYYARWAGVRLLLKNFRHAVLSHGKGSSDWQILNLGAGFDTLYFQLNAEGIGPSHFFEIDFAEVAARKALSIATHKELKSQLHGSVKFAKGEIHSTRYSLIGGDLRDASMVESSLKRHGFNPSIPTLILAECVLIYMDPLSSRNIIKWAASTLADSAFVIYEQIQPDDAFGQQMILNLESRGCPLLGIWDTPTLEAKERRFTDLGFQRATAVDMDKVYNKLLDPVDIARMEKLEIFDEFEEWHLMQEHYCIAYGVNDNNGLLHNFGIDC